MTPHCESIPTRAGRRLARAAKAAAHFDIAKSTLWHWAATRHDFPKPLRVGKRLTLFDLDAIEAYIVEASEKAA
ncbi:MULTISPECIES: AlpA family phage regulatory protein [unclassified Variovorax]|uniref:helix-turn-helix transcriptional regulator n=1 Tax=unclassified Variovorax TaxID=663243 RepID=UPI00076C6BB4|nr:MULTISPECIES: AlpA family phage regulatory protein [unclassified Variovorax]KWT83710.1 hypothetical protein APY03_4265 [Variovorax sp. WDL1]PNG46388.1 hypothetical protein CHC06_06729 [Variovorax sp. B2]PNG47790.1 hypothetical protein CHC07_06958 [Variovorax sp. B4]VTV14123.1 hypothetical protein WDL1CHR_04702 [Variovorax sp. WDL1]